MDRARTSGDAWSVGRMTDRKAIQRILERLGFVHVAGWVKVTDAPAIRRKIEAAKADVEKAKGGEE